MRVPNRLRAHPQGADYQHYVETAPRIDAIYSKVDSIDKLIFLDVDGVLAPGLLGFKVDPFCVEQFNRIVEVTQAKVCLSSTWRIFDDAEDVLLDHGIQAQFVGRTPFMGRRRGGEIQLWLDGAPVKPVTFIILDDDSDMEHLMNRLVKTDTKLGLTSKDADTAINLLNQRSGIAG